MLICTVQTLKETMAEFTNTPILNDQFVWGLKYAAALHKEQVRKDGTPYIAHLMSVSALVLEHGGDEKQAIAALLHDSIEDMNASPQEIENLFGEDVLSVVLALTHDDSLPRLQRNVQYAAAVRAAGPRAALVSAADKMHNLRCYMRGDVTFRISHLHLYNQVLPVFEEHLGDNHPMVVEMRNLLNQLTAAQTVNA